MDPVVSMITIRAVYGQAERTQCAGGLFASMNIIHIIIFFNALLFLFQYNRVITTFQSVTLFAGEAENFKPFFSTSLL